MSLLSPEAYAVIEGRHSDPFRYLGPHLDGDVPVVRFSKSRFRCKSTTTAATRNTRTTTIA